ncbi:tripartite tricarboxylate transporter TctB family protein [Mangrovicoccus ximenensis]|uniref:tripartite tricarboxylate transporter TctB family protein n=1 Tax=Mangrovicoccus ximenensis TaxID=1911570 RepID=UPI001374F9FB|nr:tripartite tricarboxylate transporter TctB family protein [Mangrovicoccus ximenensis]
MLDRNYRDAAAGIVIALMGTMIAAHAYFNLEMGTARRMGPGMVPFWLGLLMLALGAAIGLKGWRESGGRDLALPVRPLAVVGLAIAAFALAVPHVGVLPAVFLLACIATAAEPGMPLPRRLMLAAGLSAFCYVVFSLLLQLTLPMIDWRL